jgi:hypothetical protein
MGSSGKKHITIGYLFWITMVGVVAMIQIIDGEGVVSFYFPFFSLIRKLYGFTLYYLPFAAIYLVLPLFLWVCYMAWKNKWILVGLKVRYLVYFVFIFLFIYCWFYLSWGVLYKAPSLSQRLSLVEENLDSNYLLAELRWVEEKLLETRNKIWKDESLSLPESTAPEHLDLMLQKSVAFTLREWHIHSFENVRIRPLYPAGSLLVFSTAGIYLPFSGEGHYDPGLAHFHAPFVMAHELGHANGITGEADCNFVAMITCLNSNDPYIQYSGLLTYWRYLNADLKKSARYSYYQHMFFRPIAIRRDLEVLYGALDRFPEIMPMVRDVIYDSYLKANGIKDGLTNYDRILIMFKAWKKSPLNANLKQKWEIDVQ